MQTEKQPMRMSVMVRNALKTALIPKLMVMCGAPRLANAQAESLKGMNAEDLLNMQGTPDSRRVCFNETSNGA